MRKLVILLLFFISTAAFAQKTNFISEIRATVENINTGSEYKTKTLENEEFMGNEATDGGGSLTGYFKNGKLIKINEWVGLSNGIIKVEYFLNDDGNLIFAFEQKKTFQYIDRSDTTYWDSNHQGVIFENRYYFHNDKLIKKIIKGTQDPSTYSTVLIRRSKEYSALFKK